MGVQGVSCHPSPRSHSASFPNSVGCWEHELNSCWGVRCHVPPIRRQRCLNLKSALGLLVCGQGFGKHPVFSKKREKQGLFLLRADGSGPPFCFPPPGSIAGGMGLFKKPGCFTWMAKCLPVGNYLQHMCVTLNAFSSLWGSSFQRGQKEMSHSLSVLLQQQELSKASPGSHPPYGIVPPHQSTFC